MSSCLLGERVRYDGAQKRDAWIADVLPTLVELVAICPEVGAGMGVPRPAIRVVASGGRTGLYIVDGEDVTDAFDRFADAEIARLSVLGIDGYLFKARSPSCGVRDTPHFASIDIDAAPVATSAGRWAGRIATELPAIALSDESDMYEVSARDAFLHAVDVHFRMRTGGGES